MPALPTPLPWLMACDHLPPPHHLIPKSGGFSKHDTEGSRPGSRVCSVYLFLWLDESLQVGHNSL